MHSHSGVRLLHRLANAYGVQTAYYDVTHHRQPASVEGLLAVLQSLGAPVAKLEDVPSAWREYRQTIWKRPAEPVLVAWDGKPPVIKLRLPSSAANSRITGHLTLETGEHRRWHWDGGGLTVLGQTEIEGQDYIAAQLYLPGPLPWGYHRLVLDVAKKSEEALVVAAPLRAYNPPPAEAKQIWGGFLPLYALHSGKSWGSGDFSDLKVLIDWVAGMGGRVVSTLPFLATFLDSNSNPSPYSPASRLLWNEFYIDVMEIPELARCQSAQALLKESSFQKEIKAARNSGLVDYSRQLAVKRRVLKELCRCCFTDSSSIGRLQHFVKAHPIAEDYARFRATCEKRHTPWWSWPQRLREGSLKEEDYDEEIKRYHLYAQWVAHRQIESLSEGAREKGVWLYLDLPLGVHPDGYDVWRERTSFVPEVSAGAPPDIVFTRGQTWQFPPLHPENIRKEGYRYVIAYLRHNLRHAGILRIDHVMGFHRLYWIPKGLDASQGVYVRYPAEELYAVLALESQRSGTIIVGEDLGTVPPQVRPAMAQHGLNRMYVAQYELSGEPPSVFRHIPRNSVTSLNTHDMPPFAAFWQGLDIEERLGLGLLTETSAKMEQMSRQETRDAVLSLLHGKGWLSKPTADTGEVIEACLALLSASPARVVLVSLEDLWLETKAQNIPSTQKEHPNWRRKARYGLETFCQMPPVLDTLKQVNHLRRQERHRR